MKAKRPQKKQTTLVLGATGKTGRRVEQRLATRGVPTRVGLALASPPSTGRIRRRGQRTARRGVGVRLLFPRPRSPGRAGGGALVCRAGRGRAESGGSCSSPAAARRRPSVPSWPCRRQAPSGQSCGARGSARTSARTICLSRYSAARSYSQQDIPEPFVDADDIADVAVAALTDAGHAGQIYELTGPRPDLRRSDRRDRRGNRAQDPLLAGLGGGVRSMLPSKVYPRSSCGCSPTYSAKSWTGATSI